MNVSDLIKTKVEFQLYIFFPRPNAIQKQSNDRPIVCEITQMLEASVWEIFTRDTVTSNAITSLAQTHSNHYHYHKYTRCFFVCFQVLRSWDKNVLNTAMLWWQYAAFCNSVHWKRRNHSFPSKWNGLNERNTQKDMISWHALE